MLAKGGWPAGPGGLVPSARIAGVAKNHVRVRRSRFEQENRRTGGYAGGLEVHGTVLSSPSICDWQKKQTARRRLTKFNMQFLAHPFSQTLKEFEARIVVS